MQWKPVIITLLLVIFLGGSPRLVYGLKFQATLSPIKLEAKAGQVVNRAFRLVLDKGEKRTRFRAQTEDWWRSEEGGQSFYRPPGTVTRSCATWVKLNPVEASVGPGETLHVRISIAVPANVKPGGYWCVLTVDELHDPQNANVEEVGVRCLASVSIGIFVFIGPLERSMKITDVTVTTEKAMVRLRNEGNCPLTVEGRIEFTRPGDSKPLVTAPIPRGTLLLEPVNTLICRAVMPQEVPLPPGRYLVRAIFDIGLPHFIGVQKELVIAHATPSPAPREAR